MLPVAPAVVRTVLAAAVLAAAADGAHALEPGWVAGARSAVRLHAGGPDHDARGPFLRAGVEIRLDPGWKTYWRYPGDAGIPPRFDFTGSTNLADVEVLWPAPRRFTAGATTSIGYDGSVVFPLKVRPAGPGGVRLALALSYAVCESVCIPVSVSATVPLATAPLRTAGIAPDGAGRAALARIAPFEARVPRRAALGAPGPLAVTGLAVDRDRRPWRVVVDVDAPAGVDLFAEGPDESWALPLPAALPADGPGRMRFAFDLDGAPPGADPATASLTLTLVAPGGEAVEVAVPLDGAVARAK